MNFVFENIEERNNLGNTFNKSGSPRFTLSPFNNLIGALSELNEVYEGMSDEYSIDARPNKYIITVGTHNDPHNFFGGELSEHENYPSAFSFLPTEYVKDLQDKKAFLLFDNSLEGFHDDFIFEYLHYDCKNYGISPSRLIYITGNLLVEKQYEEWLTENPQEEKLNPLPYPNFETDIYLFSRILPEGNQIGPPDFEEQLEYKTKNVDSIKLFSCLNKKPRLHRVNFYKLLYLNRLVNKGLVSMEHFGVHGEDFGGSGEYEFCGYNFPKETLDEMQKTLPSRIYNKSNEEYDPGYYVKRFHPEVALDSWIQVISETYFYNNDNNLFLSEKTFKVIASSQPFIILGNKGSLRELRKLGYKTFGDFFDESYDEMDDCERMDAIIKILRDINKIEDKLSWFNSMKDILEHNKKTLIENCTKRTPYVYQKVLELYNNG